MRTSLCEDLTRSKVIGVETIDGILQKIQSGYTKEQTLLARSFGKGTPAYDSIKKKMETFTPNGYFHSIRAIANLVDFTGYIYLDFDHTSSRATVTNTPFIYSCWSSLSGEGFGAIAKVDGLNSDNFLPSWLYLENYFKNLGLTVDPQTKDISRQNVISFDPNIYVNTNCSILNAYLISSGYTSTISNNQKPIYNTSNSSTNKPNFKSSPSSSSKPNHVFSCTRKEVDFSSDKDIVKMFSNDKLIYKTLLDDYHGLDYIVIEEGKDYRCVYLPKEIGDGKRHFWLACHTLNLLFLNPSITYERLEKEVMRANYYYCKPSLKYKQVIRITEWYYGRHTANLINFKTKKKKIWINPSTALTTKEKKSIIGREVGAIRKKNTLKNIQEAYNLLKVDEPRVTQIMVKDYLLLKDELIVKELKLERKPRGICIRTIKSFWNQISM